MTPLKLTCDEDSRDSITFETEGENCLSPNQCSVSMFSDNRDPDTGYGYTDEILVYLDRAKARQVRDWLSAWLDGDGSDVPKAFNGCDQT